MNKNYFLKICLVPVLGAAAAVVDPPSENPPEKKKTAFQQFA